MDFLPPSGNFSAIGDTAPARYRAHRVAAAGAWYAEDDAGHYFIQTVTGKEFLIQWNIFRILADGACLYALAKAPRAVLHFMLQGDTRCTPVNGEEAWLHEGIYHLFYVPGGVRHEIRFRARGLYLSFHIELPPSSLPELSAKHPEVKDVADSIQDRSSRSLRQHPAHITGITLRLLDELRHCPYNEEPEKSLYLENRVRELLLLYVQDKPAVRESSVMSRRMEKAAYYLQYHLEEHLTLPLVAAHVHLSISTFKRWFMQYFGQSFRRYLFEKRMEYAKTLLRETDKTLLEIAVNTGYSDAATFSHAFSNYSGTSPGEYRKENR